MNSNSQNRNPNLSRMLGRAIVTATLGVCVMPMTAALGQAVESTQPAADVGESIIDRRVRELSTRIEALPTVTADATRTRAILRVAVETAHALHLSMANAGVSPDADQTPLQRAEVLLSDVESMLKDAENGRFDAGRRVSEQSFMLPMSREADVVALFERDIEFLKSRPNLPLAAPTTKKSSFANVGASRDNGDLIFAALVASAHPQSRFLDDPELFERALRAIAGYVESHRISKGDPNLNEFFTMEKNFFAIFCFDRVFPGALLPSQRQAIAEGLDSRAAAIEKRFVEGDLINWCNADISYAAALIHGGLLANRPRLIEIGEAVVNQHVSEQFPDGGFAYVRGQNECLGYHHIVVRVLNRLWMTTGSETARLGVVRSAPFTLLSIEPVVVGSFAMSPAWKSMWNNSYSTAPEAVYHSKNPYLKTYQLVRRAYAERLRPRLPISAMEVLLDLSDVQAKPLPDGYIVQDRNLQGLRARQSTFSIAATAREVRSPVGLETLITATSTDRFDPQRPFPLNAAIDAVGAGPTFDESRRVQASGHIMANLSSTLLLGRDAAGLTASYSLAAQDFGPRMIHTDHTGRQQWVVLPDRIVGRVEVTPGSTPAVALHGRVRLAYGAVGIAVYKTEINDLGQNRFEYGGLRVAIHDHNFDSVDIERETNVFREQRPVGTDVRLTHAIDPAVDTNRTPRYYIVEIRDRRAATDANAIQIDTGKLQGLRVTHDGRTTITLMNVTDSPVPIRPTELAGGAVSVLRKVVDDTPPAPQSLPAEDLSEIVLAPGEGITLLTGDRAAEPAWNSFESMLQSLEKSDHPAKPLQYLLPGIQYR